jgi:hypothetical protein
MIYLLINNIITVICVVIAYNLGLRNNQKLKNGEKIDILPEIKVELPKLFKTEAEKQLEKDQIEAERIWRNLNNYDGTSASQIPQKK